MAHTTKRQESNSKKTFFFDFTIKSYFRSNPPKLSISTMPGADWRIINMSFNYVKEKPGVYAISFELFRSEFFNKNRPDDKKLELFRNIVVSTISLATLMPVYLESNGVANWWTGSNKYCAHSLGFMDKQGILGDYEDYVSIFMAAANANRPELRNSLYFFWQSFFAPTEILRFSLLTMAVELLVNDSSLKLESKYPSCQKCKKNLEKCPNCESKWAKLSPPLQDRVLGLLKDEQLAKKFYKARNTVFHPSSSRLDEKFEIELVELNNEVLLAYRRFFQEKLMLSPVGDVGVYLGLGEFVTTLTVHLTAENHTLKLKGNIIKGPDYGECEP